MAKIEVFVKGSVIIDLDEDNYDAKFARELSEENETIGELVDRLDGFSRMWNFDNLKILEPHQVDNYTFALRDDEGNIIYSND